MFVVNPTKNKKSEIDPAAWMNAWSKSITDFWRLMPGTDAGTGAETSTKNPASQAQKLLLSSGKMLHLMLTKMSDLANINATLQGEGPQFVELAARFAARLGGKLDEMIDACTAQRYPDLAELAHWLKGAGGTVGYDVFTKPARLLETAAKSRQEGPVLQAMRALPGDGPR